MIWRKNRSPFVARVRTICVGLLLLSGVNGWAGVGDTSDYGGSPNVIAPDPNQVTSLEVSVDPSKNFNPASAEGISGGSVGAASATHPGPTLVQCQDEAKKAAGACNTLTGFGMDPQSAMMTMMFVGQVPKLIAQLTSSGKNQAQQCQVQSELTTVVSGLSKVMAFACNAQMNKCSVTCKQVHAAAVERGAANPADPTAKTDAAASETASIACQGYNVNMALMMMQSFSLDSNTLNNQQCASLSSVSAGLAAATPYSVPTPVGGCDGSPAAQSNITCICRANPKDPMCNKSGNGQPFGGGGTQAGGGAGAGTPASASSTADNGTPIDPSGAPGKSEHGVAGGDGGGGGGLGNGGGGGGPVATGQTSGGGASGSGMGIAATSGGGGGNKGSGGGGGTGGGAAFDPRLFMPKDKYANRGLAGMTVQSVDGLTGPMGPSIWEKVSNQYQTQKSNLLLDK